MLAYVWMPVALAAIDVHRDPVRPKHLPHRAEAASVRQVADDVAPTPFHIGRGRNGVVRGLVQKSAAHVRGRSVIGATGYSVAASLRRTTSIGTRRPTRRLGLRRRTVPQVRQTQAARGPKLVLRLPGASPAGHLIAEVSPARPFRTRRQPPLSYIMMLTERSKSPSEATNGAGGPA